VTEQTFETLCPSFAAHKRARREKKAIKERNIIAPQRGLNVSQHPTAYASGKRGKRRAL
jgi:hypothetical protein